jgi:hypothetical protein
MILPKNLEKLNLKGCPHCGSFETSEEAEETCMKKFPKQWHWPELPASHYNYFKIDSVWYIVKRKDVDAFLSLIEVEEAVFIQGAMHSPKPIRLDNQTQLIALLQKKGVAQEQLSKHFRMSHMRGRVFKQLVKG